MALSADADALSTMWMAASLDRLYTMPHDVEPSKGDVQVSWEHTAAASDGACYGIDQGS